MHSLTDLLTLGVAEMLQGLTVSDLLVNINQL